MLAAKLWNRNRDLTRACLDHPFVRGLGDGTLDRDAFNRYVAQDAFFMRAFLRAYAIGAARCDEFEHARCFHRFMGGVLDELKLHADYAAKLGIDLDAVTPFAATSAYIDFLQRTAWHCSVAETVAAMTPCMRLYAYLGEQLRGRLWPDHPYAEWIHTYGDEDFDRLAGEVEALLDAVAEDTPAVRDAYRYAMQCELDFFSAPLEDMP
ncbi:MAG: TenA family protein [Phycisphaerales bacterium]|nr:MAG: TenA family protein [Phycisphaerales bacterium]